MELRAIKNIQAIRLKMNLLIPIIKINKLMAKYIPTIKPATGYLIRK